MDIHATCNDRLLLDGSNANVTIDIGSEDFTTLGKGTFGELNVDNITIDGAVISSDTLTVGFSNNNISTTANVFIVSDVNGLALGAGPDVLIYADAPGAVHMLAAGGTNDLALHFETADSNNGSITWKGVTQEFDFSTYSILTAGTVQAEQLTSTDDAFVATALYAGTDSQVETALFGGSTADGAMLRFGTAGGATRKGLINANPLIIQISSVPKVTIDSTTFNASDLNIETTGTVQGATLTDGTLSIASGSITSAVNGTFSGVVQAVDFYLEDSDLILDRGTILRPSLRISAGASYLEISPLAVYVSFKTNATAGLRIYDSVFIEDKLKVGTTVHNIQISALGDLTFHGGAGLVFGSFWGNNIALVTAGGSGTYFPIFDGDITTGQLHNVTHNVAGENTLDIGAKLGMYKVDWSISVKATGANKHITAGIGVDAGGGAGFLTVQDAGQDHVMSVGSAEFALCGTAILDLSANSEVGLMATNETDGTNVTIEHVNLVMVQIGGT